MSQRAAQSLALLLSVLCVASQAHAQGGRKGKPNAMGSVQYATADRAYLNRGSKDGLQVGTALEVMHRGQPAGLCRVDAVAESTATCVGKDLRPGDTYKFAATLPPEPEAPRPVPAPLSASELNRQRAVVERKEQTLVEFDEAQAAPKPFHALIGFRHYATIPALTVNGTFQQEMVDIQLRNLRLLRGLTADVALTAMQWTQRPGDARLPQGSNTRLWVRQASLTYDPPEGRFSFLLGRTNPFGIPGLPILDGVQLALRNGDRSWRGGAFVGSTPGAFDLGLTTRWTAGGFISADVRTEGDSWVQTQARLAVVTRPNASARYEVEPLLSAQLGKFVNLSTQLRFGFGSQTAPGFLDQARLDFTVRASDRFMLYLDGRYIAETDDSVISGLYGIPARGFHTVGGLQFSLFRGMDLGFQAVVSRDLVSVMTHTLAGPELIFPHAFGDATSLRIGYQEELGWVRGRNLYGQITYAAKESWQVFLRMAYMGQVVTGDEDAGMLSNELSFYLAFDSRISSFLRFRASSLIRSDLSAWQESRIRAASFSGATLNLQIIAEL